VKGLYALNLERIYMDSIIQRTNLFKFASVGASGAVVNLLVLWLFTDFGHLFYLFSAFIAIEISILWNFFFNTKFTFNYRFKNNNSIFYSMMKYHLSSFIGSLINLFVLIILTEYINLHYIISEAAAIFLAFSTNYMLSINYIWYKKA